MTNHVDLHTHSTASDGSYRPAEVVHLAKDAGLRAMALTDHDTTDGLAEALAAGAELGVEVIPGVEISTRHVGDSMHILGYFLDFHSGKLAERLAVLKQARKDRNPKIIAKLNALGLAITMEQVERISGGGQVGRPHIARVLLERGYVRTMQQAFDIYLKNGGKAYVAKFRFPPAEALEMIREAGGVPVLAHPFTLGLGSLGALRDLLRDLQALGLAGIETFYAEHTPEQEALYLKLAQELGLLVTGGSDFHGDNKPEVTLGNIRSRNRLTYDLVTALKAWRKKEYGLV
ncbi:MAG: PHP domain-containing protein [Deltaproteobacteria bacterium]|nr:PHP domain-containing protein [Deltaproteobacteria bacterium]MBI4796723.1 PHP domain-containing protein [Deltaproteobacteria bacterium]